MFEAPVSCKPRPRFGNGLLRDAWGVLRHAASRASKMTSPIRIPCLPAGRLILHSTFVLPLEPFLQEVSSTAEKGGAERDFILRLITLSVS